MRTDKTQCHVTLQSHVWVSRDTAVSRCGDRQDAPGVCNRGRAAAPFCLFVLARKGAAGAVTLCMNVSVEDVQQHLYVTLCMNGCIVAAPLCHFKRNCRCLYTANRRVVMRGCRWWAGDDRVVSVVFGGNQR